MSTKVINDNYARLDGVRREARRIYVEAWMRWGFTILLLHKRAKNGFDALQNRQGSALQNQAI
jgi:hypothetical protein